MGNRHHYVPKLLLRAFQCAPKRIHLYNLKRGVLIRDASLRDQCYSHQRYGADGATEDALADLEGLAAGALRKVEQEARVPPENSEDYGAILAFIAVQKLRTIEAQSNARRMFAALGGAMFDTGPPPNWALESRELMRMLLSVLPEQRRAMTGLKLALVQAVAPSAFILSDNPVFQYNSYCEGISYTGVTGTKVRGYQLFLPISPSSQLILYDPAVYRVGNRKSSDRIPATPADVAELNRLQVCSAHENVYFNEEWIAERIPAALASVRKPRERSKPRANVAASDSVRNEELLHLYWPMPNLGLRLSFLSVTRNARKVPLLERSHRFRGPPSGPDLTDESTRTPTRFTVRRTVE